MSEEIISIAVREQLEQLNTSPDPNLITPPDKYVTAPYLSGEVVTHYLNEVFTPLGWGYELIDWPELKQFGDGADGMYICRGRVWFRFENGEKVERLVPGMCAIRAGRNRSAEEAGFNLVRMAYQGAITDMIKNAASTLGPRLGLGLNDQLLSRELRLGMGPQKTPEKDMEDLTGKRPASTQGKRPTRRAPSKASRAKAAQPKTTPPAESKAPDGNGKSASSHWIDDKKQRAGFFAGLAERGLTENDAHLALGVKSLHDYQGDLSAAWAAIYQWIGEQREKATVADVFEDYNGEGEQDIPW